MKFFLFTCCGGRLVHGEKRMITIFMDGEAFEVKLSSSGFDVAKHPNHSEQWQILYGKNSPFAKKLREKFSAGQKIFTLYPTDLKDTFCLEPEFACDETTLEKLLDLSTLTEPQAALIERFGLTSYRKLNREHGEKLKRTYRYRCQICGQNFGEFYGVNLVDCHHIAPFSESINNDKSNLLIVCPNHHTRRNRLPLPRRDAYITYTTRGCIRKCAFCAVSKLEPEYKDHVPIFNQLRQTEEHFGAKRNLLLMDNNVLASAKFDEIVDEIKACGFGKGATYLPPDQYDVTLKNLRGGFNICANLRKMIRLYDDLERRLPENAAGDFYSRRDENFLLNVAGATVEKILELDEYVRPLFEKYFKRKRLARYVDFNQGLDARLIDEHKMARLAELNLHPMRIAFDHIEQRDIYERAIRLAAKYGVRDLSNYLLYNFLDTPEDFYRHLKINIDLCEELDVSIYSFPRKYCPRLTTRNISATATTSGGIGIGNSFARFRR